MKLLAKSVTPLATIYAYENLVRVVSMFRGHQFILSGDVLSNVFGNQEYLLPFTELKNVYQMIGTIPPIKGVEGSSADFIIAKASEVVESDPGGQLYRVGFCNAASKTNLVLLDAEGITALLRACRIALWEGGKVNYNSGFWLAKSFVGDNLVTITDVCISIHHDDADTLDLTRGAMAKWLMYFQAIGEMKGLGVGSQHRVEAGVHVFKTAPDLVCLKIEDDNRKFTIVFSFGFFSGLQTLMERFWLGEEDDDPCEGCTLAEEYGSEDDDEEMGAAS